MSTQFTCQKQFYFKPFSLVKKLKWSQVLLCITKNSIKYQSFIFTQLNVKTVLFQTIQFSLSTQFSYIWTIDGTLLGATTPGQCEFGSDNNKRVLSIPKSSSIRGASLSDYLVSYLGHSSKESYCSADMQSVYSTVLAELARDR